MAYAISPQAVGQFRKMRANASYSSLFKEHAIPTSICPKTSKSSIGTIATARPSFSLNDESFSRIASLCNDLNFHIFPLVLISKVCNGYTLYLHMKRILMFEARHLEN